MKRLIVTGDDFGISADVNEAIERAHQEGILTTASLMVGAQAAGDAINRAWRLPSLRVGLHLVLVDGPPVLPACAIPDLLDSRGNFSSHLARTGIRFFFLPRVRRQLEAEIRAQFLAFQRTGLALDHVNSHHHMHLHPTLSRILLRVGKGYGLNAVRLPYEPPIPSWRASGKGLFPKLAISIFLYPWIALLKDKLRRESLSSNNYVFGMSDSGSMNFDLLLRFLKHLPDGCTEIYFHPAISGKKMNAMTEFEALTSPEIRQTLLTSGIERIAFSDLRAVP